MRRKPQITTCLKKYLKMPLLAQMGTEINLMKLTWNFKQEKQGKEARKAKELM